jgi:hypothetical protein
LDEKVADIAIRWTEGGATIKRGTADVDMVSFIYGNSIYLCCKLFLVNALTKFGEVVVIAFKLLWGHNEDIVVK